MDKRFGKTPNIEKESKTPSTGDKRDRLRSEHGLQTSDGQILRLEKMQLGEEHDQQSDQTHEGASSIKHKRTVPDFSTRQYESQQPEVQEHNQLQSQLITERGSGSTESDLIAQESPQSSRSDLAPNVPASQDCPSSLTPDQPEVQEHNRRLQLSKNRNEEALKHALHTLVKEVCKLGGDKISESWGYTLGWGHTLGTGLGEYLSGISAGRHHIMPDIESGRHILKMLAQEGGQTIAGKYIGKAIIAALGVREKTRLEAAIRILSQTALAAGGVYVARHLSDLISDTTKACLRMLRQQRDQVPEQIVSDASRSRNVESIEHAYKTFVMELCTLVGKEGWSSWGYTQGAGLGAYLHGISVGLHPIMPDIESRKLILKTSSKEGGKRITGEHIGKAIIAALGAREKSRLEAAIPIFSKAAFAAVGIYLATRHGDYICDPIRIWKSCLESAKKVLEMRQIGQVDNKGYIEQEQGEQK